MKDTRSSQSQTNLSYEVPIPKSQRHTSTAPRQTESPRQQPAKTGSKEYRDAVKRNRSSSPEMMNYNSQPQRSPNQSPKRNPTSSRLKDEILESQCAWCVANGQKHNHSTSQCGLLKNADEIDQYKVIYKYRVCTKCLSPTHYWRECPSSVPKCQNCNFPHHPNIGCRPGGDISPYRKSQ